jgi:hypothetical protein
MARRAAIGDTKVEQPPAVAAEGMSFTVVRSGIGAVTRDVPRSGDAARRVLQRSDQVELDVFGREALELAGESV